MNKLRLLEITYQKVSADKEFMAYYFVKVIRLYSKTQVDLIEFFNCSEENFYKLGLCKLPDAEQADFSERMNRIAEYTNVSLAAITHVIALVNPIKKELTLPTDIILFKWLSDVIDFTEKTIINFRKTIAQLVNNSNLSPIRHRILRTTLTFGKVTLLLILVLAFITNLTTIGKIDDTSVLYKTIETDQNKGVQYKAVRDNTFVAPSLKNPCWYNDCT